MASAADIQMIADGLRLIHGPGDVMELRALEVKHGRFISTEAGYYDYDHIDQMAKAAAELSADADGVYQTINPLKPDLVHRRYNRVDQARKGDGSTATDDDAVCRRQLLIDVDPSRLSDISSTDAEKAAARELIDEVNDYLQLERSWPAPVEADSGNGYHLLFRIALPKDDGQLVERLLKALAIRFDTEAVTIDTSVHNPARITKIYGTWARKGDNTPLRPHRQSKILTIPDVLDVVSPEQIQQVIDEFTPPAAPESSNGHRRQYLDSTAWNHIDKIERSISGCKGSNNLFRAARVVIMTHGASDAEAVELLARWNVGCQPEWSEKEIAHKISQVHSKARQAPERREQQHSSSSVTGAKQAPVTPIKLKGTPFSQILRRQVSYIWEHRIPCGMITVIDSDPGMGKTFIVSSIAARVSQGWQMPPAPSGCAGGDPGNVLIFNDEDDPEVTLRPRLENFGADLDRIIQVESNEAERFLAFPNDIAALEEMIREHKATLAIFDPIFAFMAEEVNTNNDASIRRALSPLHKVARATNCAIVLIRHLNKQGGSNDPVYRGGGSIGVIASARCSHIVGVHPDDENLRVFAPNKMNICSKPPALTYSIDDQGTFRWHDEVEISARDLLTKNKVAEKQHEDGQKVRTAGSKMLAKLDELDPKRLGVGKVQLHRLARVSYRDLECAALELVKEGVLESVMVESRSGKNHSVVKMVDGLRRPPISGTDATDATDATETSVAALTD